MCIGGAMTESRGGKGVVGYCQGCWTEPTEKREGEGTLEGADEG